jgi:DNA mismatch repair ATPase MutS
MLQLLQLIEALDIKTALLTELKSSLFKNQLSASKQIHQLTKLLDALDNRNNLIVGIILNALLLWDWNLLFRIENWRQNHELDYNAWQKTIAYFDALNSLAGFSFNHPAYAFPTLSNELYAFEADSLGHPMLPVETRICNNFNLSEKPRYAIITGANMAGKSTFLRTIATNLVLAGCGAPVCAKKLHFKPLPLYSSMRTEDSLMKNESYFFAELKRLQHITQELEKGQQLFIILDEILRGTNSEDKRKGSIGFVKKITQKMAYGLIATHDLELARLAEQQPDIFKALCFEVAFKNDELKFDYKLKAGVTQNMNASFLMERMGIIDKK